jgi:hypothetical protein
MPINTTAATAAHVNLSAFVMLSFSILIARRQDHTPAASVSGLASGRPACDELRSEQGGRREARGCRKSIARQWQVESQSRARTASASLAAFGWKALKNLRILGIPPEFAQDSQG